MPCDYNKELKPSMQRILMMAATMSGVVLAFVIVALWLMYNGVIPYPPMK